MNLYLDERLVSERLSEARAMAAQLALVRRLRPTRLPARVAAGMALIRVGRWLVGCAPKQAGAQTRVAV